MVIELGLVAFVVRYFLRDSPQGRNAQRPGSPRAILPNVACFDRYQSNVGLRVADPTYISLRASPRALLRLPRSTAYSERQYPCRFPGSVTTT